MISVDRQYPFEFIKVEVKTEYEEGEDSNFICDPFDENNYIHMKEESDSKWEQNRIDNNQNGLNDKLIEDSSNDITSKDLPVCKKYSIGTNCSIDFCRKYVISQPDWLLEHSYSKCYNCSYKPQEVVKSTKEICVRKLDNSSLVSQVLESSVYQCDFCIYKTLHKSRLLSHMNLHLKPLVCKWCGKKNACTLLKCDKCSYQTCDKQRLEQHSYNIHMIVNGEETNLKNKIFKACPQCGKIYHSLSIRDHLPFCSNEPEISIECHLCSFTSARPCDLKKHVMMKHGKICPRRCGKILSSKINIRSHYSDCPLIPFLKCNYCTFKTKYRLCLKKHICRQHFIVEQEEYECVKCLSKYKHLITFQNHLLACLKSPRMQCDFCTYRTYIPSSLTAHVMKIHCSKKNCCRLPCPKCGSRFDNISLWKGHLLHNCERPHKKTTHQVGIIS